MSDTDLSELRAQAAESFLSLPAHSRDCIVAILLEAPNGLVLHGTGTLFRMGDYAFLVTASHVLLPDSRRNPRKSLFLVGPSGTAPIRLRWNKLIGTRPPGMDDDAADVAVLEVNEATIDALGDCTLLNQVDIQPDDDLREDFYFVVGFPEPWANITEDEARRGLALLTYCTQIQEGGSTSWKYRADWNLLLKLGGGERLFGGKAQMPNTVKGMSGGSVWRSNFTRGGGPGDARVVAVQTSTLRDGTVFKATRWAAIVHLLMDAYPQLRQPGRVLLPRRGP